MPIYHVTISRFGGAEINDPVWASAAPVEQGEVIKVRGVNARVEKITPNPPGDPLGRAAALLCIEAEA
jgi:hypothetical protein